MEREILVDHEEVLLDDHSCNAAAVATNGGSSMWDSDYSSVGVPNQLGNTAIVRSSSSSGNGDAFNTSSSPAAAAAEDVFLGDGGGDHQEMRSPPRLVLSLSATSSSFPDDDDDGEEGRGGLSPNLGNGFGTQHPQWMKEQWEVNYKEAAIFLEEGVNNDKFTHHPRSREELPAYLMVHNNWFYIIDLGAALVLLALGFVEQPCYQPLCVPTQIHSSIELCILLLVAIQVFLKTRWVGWRTFLRHKRTLIKFSTLTIMTVEAIVVLVRSDSHFRVTRALRPIFLIDNQFCGGVRRFIRQIFQSLPAILDMLGLVLFITLIYSVFGFYLFGQTDPENFGSLKTSFISLFVLVTTANYPDVMMKSYNDSRWSAVFFISYISINLYSIMNMLLAVVYDAFTRIEREKFRRLFLHKRKAAQHAFKLLVTKERKDQVSLIHFEGLLRFYKGVTSPTEAYLVFKLLNTSKSGYLVMEEFYGIYDACRYSWNISKPDQEWFHDLRDPWRRILVTVRRVVTSSWFEYSVCVVVLSNGIILLVQTWLMKEPSAAAAHNIYAPWVSYFFVGLYSLEATFKLLGLGIGQYFSSFWNMFDFGVTALGILSLILEVLNIPLFYVIILRPLRLLTLFRMKKRFRDVFGTAVILYPRLTSAVIVLLLIYYFFGTIGMECLHNVDLINCCKNTSIEPFYKYEKGSASNSYFYLNNFDSLTSAGVTLFELTVVNNWQVIMEGYAITTGTDWSRLYFMSFYIFTMIVMTIIVAFILEAFLFRIQYKEFLSKNEEQKKLSAEIVLTSNEIDKILARSGETDQRLGIPRMSCFTFIGLKTRTKEQLQMLMYTVEMDQWIAEAQQEEARIQASMVQQQQTTTTTDSGWQDLYHRRRQQQQQQPGMFGNEVMQQPRAVGEEMVQVVRDAEGGEVTTILRPVLPDVREQL